MRYCRLIICIFSLMWLLSCSDDNAPDSIEPLLYVNEAADITRTEATLSGGVELQRNTDMPTLHFLYGTTAEPEYSSKELVVNDNKVSLRLVGLTAGTTYYFRLQGGNGSAVINSDVRTFTTMPNDKPKVGMLTVLSHGPTSVIASYAITDDGGESIIETGCYITEENSDDSVKVISEQTESTDGSYRIRIGGLKQNSTYSLIPFAASRAGESKGEPTKITTTNAVVLEAAGKLEELIGEDKYSYTELSFVGSMNGDDLNLLRQMAGRDFYGNETPGKLERINLADAKIVAGGGNYVESRYTQDDVVGYGLFAGCTGLKSISLPIGATVMEQNVFTGCTSLSRLEIPASMTSLTPSAGCVSLSEINVSPANTSYSSKDGVLFNADGSEIVWFPMGKDGDYTLPSTVVSIGDYAFQECSITRFTLPDNIGTIGQAVFFNSKVQEVDMPEALRLVPTATFQNCSQLTVVRLGSQTELVSDYVFDGCPLEHLYIEAKYPPVCNDNAFTSRTTAFTKTCTLHVPKGYKGWYKNDPDWGMFENIVEY